MLSHAVRGWKDKAESLAHQNSKERTPHENRGQAVGDRAEHGGPDAACTEIHRKEPKRVLTWSESSCCGRLLNCGMAVNSSTNWERIGQIHTSKTSPCDTSLPCEPLSFSSRVALDAYTFMTPHDPSITTSTTTTQPTTHDQTTSTTQAHDQNEDDTKDDDEKDDDDTLLILSQITTAELPQHQSNHIKRTRSRKQQPGFLMTHSS